MQNRYALSFFLKEAMEVADLASSESSFHILGASYAKLGQTETVLSAMG